MGLLASLLLFSPAFLCDYVRLWFGGAISFMVMWLRFALDFSGSRARLFIPSSTFLSGCVICLTVPQIGPVELLLFLNVWLKLPPHLTCLRTYIFLTFPLSHVLAFAFVGFALRELSFARSS